MPICKKCGEQFSQYKKIDGKLRNFQRRKYCLTCSPFGFRNTKKLEYGGKTKICKICGKLSNINRNICSSCQYHQNKKKIRDKVYNIIGLDCWRCGYNKGEQSILVLEFHHLVPSNKTFELTLRRLMGRKWMDVWKEMQKCVSLCCLCHREFHAGIISKEEIKNIHIKRWDKILLPL